jgi:hypothetical protein
MISHSLTSVALGQIVLERVVPLIINQELSLQRIILHLQTRLADNITKQNIIKRKLWNWLQESGERISPLAMPRWQLRSLNSLIFTLSNRFPSSSPIRSLARSARNVLHGLHDHTSPISVYMRVSRRLSALAHEVLRR